MGRPHKQAAVIAYRIHGEHVEIALVKRSNGRGWTVPKGSLDRGETGGDAAVREAEEEAGLLGKLTGEPIGRYCYSKQNERYQVDVYVMRVTIVLESWREAAHRRRRWMAVEEAIERLRPELHGLVETVRSAQSPIRRRSGAASDRLTASPAGTR